jgi:hypothetical protein
MNSESGERDRGADVLSDVRRVAIQKGLLQGLIFLLLVVSLGSEQYRERGGVWAWVPFGSWVLMIAVIVYQATLGRQGTSFVRLLAIAAASALLGLALPIGFVWALGTGGLIVLAGLIVASYPILAKLADRADRGQRGKAPTKGTPM